MKKYVIYKRSRNPQLESYNGPTWDRAGCRDSRQARYDSKEEAEELAAMLTHFNPVGFAVAELGELENKEEV
jgi:hypothetical protein